MKLLLLLPLLLMAQVASADEGSNRIPPDADGAMDALNSSSRHGEWVDIPLTDNQYLHTWVVHPERKDKAPVVIVIHEIFGMTDWVRAVTDQLAADGFVAVAPDLLSGKGPHGGNTDSFAADDVRAAIQKLTPDEVAQRLDAARAYAIALPNATDKVATVGFCWGGGASFAYATHQPKLNAAVVYYGTPPKDHGALQKITCPIAGFYGGDDARVTATVEPTKKTMSELNKSYDPHIYDGAGHGFLRQQTAREGNAKAAQQAWPTTIQFLRMNLESK
jgi:carboxymethylenebutenolidase